MDKDAVIKKFLSRQLTILEDDWRKAKEEEIVTLHNEISDVINRLKPHSSVVITVLRIIEHEVILDALKKIEEGKPAEEVLKQDATKKTAQQR